MHEPWYKQFWPWFLMSLPATAVVAGIATIIIAVKSDDGLVADDYYKEGLAINRELARDLAARKLNLTASAVFDPASRRLQIQINGKYRKDPVLYLAILHPTRAAQDQRLVLHKANKLGVYRGTLQPLAPGNWHLRLEPEDQAWRIHGRAQLPGKTNWQLAPVK